MEDLFPAPPTLIGAHLLLRPVTSDDYAILYGWETDVSTMFLWRPHAAIPRYDDFVQSMRNGGRDGMHIQLLLVDRATNSPVGTVFSFDISLVNGYVSLGAYIATAHRGRKHGPEGGALFIDYLFAYYPMRKIYTDIFSYNAHSLHVATRYGFEVEATFKRHRWYRDRYWDVYRVALYRETWDRVRNELAPLMDPGAADA